MAISGLNTGQVLTVKNLTIGGYYTTTQAIGDSECLTAKDLTVYDYNPITKYELKVNLHISSGYTFLFLPNFVAQNNEFVAVVPTSLGTVMLGDESSFNNYNSDLVGSTLSGSSSSTSGGLYSIKEEWTGNEYPLLWFGQQSSYSTYVPARLSSGANGYRCYNVGQDGINDFYRYQLGYIPFDGQINTVLSFTGTSKQSRTISYALQIFNPNYGDYENTDFYYGQSGFSSCNLFRPHHTCFTMTVPFSGAPTIFNGNATVTYSEGSTYTTGTTEVTERYVYISNLGFVSSD